MEHYVPRILYLLGCCGHIAIDYPGEPFVEPMTAEQSATRVLAETDLALRGFCASDWPARLLHLKLVRISALALRSRSLIAKGTEADTLSGLRDSELAARELRTVLKQNPSIRIMHWQWVPLTFQQIGRPMEAVAAIRLAAPKLPVDGRTWGQATMGDLLFDMALYKAAAMEYSEWLVQAQSFCGRRLSLKNIGYLRQRLFKINANASESIHDESRCFVEVEWIPYEVLPPVPEALP